MELGGIDQEMEIYVHDTTRRVFVLMWGDASSLTLYVIYIYSPTIIL